MNLFIRTTIEMGRGVYANKSFACGEIIEVCPLIMGSGTGDSLPTWLEKYVFAFDRQPAIALGYGSLYNHSPKPNATYHFSKRDKTVVIKACRPIGAKSQIFIDYGISDSHGGSQRHLSPKFS